MQTLLSKYDDHDFSGYYIGSLKFVEKGLKKEKFWMIFIMLLINTQLNYINKGGRWIKGSSCGYYWEINNSFLGSKGSILSLQYFCTPCIQLAWMFADWLFLHLPLSK